MIKEIVKNKDAEKSSTEIETYESIEKLELPQEYDDGGIIILDNPNEKEMNDQRVQAMFKRSGHSISIIFIVSQDYYELPKRTIRANGNIYHIFKPYNFLSLHHIRQDKASMDMTLKEFK